MTGLVGRVALVTGGGRGLGRAHAVALGRAGAAVVVNDVGRGTDGRGPAENVAGELARELVAVGVRAVADTSDISTFAGAAAAVATAVDAFGGIDILVNNAGIVDGGRLADIEQAVLERVLAVHLTGTVGTVRAALPHMLGQGWGRIVNTVSEVALTPPAGGSGVAYGAAKAAVWSATLSMATELAGSGVTVNGISPGALTRMSREAVAASPASRALDLDPAHVAAVVAYLCSDEAQDLSGHVVHVAGGHVREYPAVRRTRNSDLVRRLESRVLRATP
jgi:NAD(P)-dependent dehydrogenase (short-subunit alcohol dehydrogenase family)